MRLLQRTTQNVMGQRGQQAVIVKTESAEERAGASQFHQLSRRQTHQDVGNLVAEPQTEHRCGIVITQHTLRK